MAVLSAPPVSDTCLLRSRSSLLPTRMRARLVAQLWPARYCSVSSARVKLSRSVMEYTTMQAAGSYVDTMFSTFTSTLYRNFR